MIETPFHVYCRRKEAEASAATPPGYRTVFDRAAGQGLRPIGNDWTRALFDGPFYVREPVTSRQSRGGGGLPAVSLVFVQSREGNTVADDPSILGGGETDKHLVYEGLSRVIADAVLAGASTARGDETIFSVWHPQLVALRLESGKPRHPAQVVLTARADLPLDSGLMFTTPELHAFIIAPSRVVDVLRGRLRGRPWIDVIDAGDPLTMTTAMRQLCERGLRVISAVGGRQTATLLLGGGLVTDVYLTTSTTAAGEPGTPFYIGDPPPTSCLVEKTGRGVETGVRFEHLTIRMGE